MWPSGIKRWTYAKWLVHKCINGLSSNLVEGKQKQLATFIYGLVDTNAIIFIVSSNQQKDSPTYSNLWLYSFDSSCPNIIPLI